jgi:aspartyl-tRNA(Asn)/glutamyl-tRNA(Gln) amidotransferase subunit A
MAESELTSLSLMEAAHLVTNRQVSPVELTKAYLERIERLDATLKSFITVTAEKALQEARQAEKELARRDRPGRGALLGIPIALKDLFFTRGIRTTAGSTFFADFIPDQDALVVEKLNQAGAVLLGKTNMHEIALGLTNINPHFGTCRNPWALERVSGGSSGGSAVALAAGLCAGALGSDTGGSIRVPAALCDVVGLKPTFGRVSKRGVFPLSWNLDHVGPMGRRVADVALLLGVIAGYDRMDPYSVDVPVDDYLANIDKGVRGWRIALASDEFFEVTEPEIQGAVNQAAKVFEDLGAQVSQVAFPEARPAALANGLMVISDAAAFHKDRLAEKPQGFGDDVLQRLQTGASLALDEYIRARQTQSNMRREFERFFEEYDVLLMPTTMIVAPPIEGQDASEQPRLLTRYTAAFNLTGLPALSIPCGFSSAGLPIGLQIIARPWAEARLLQAAHAYEQATSWHLRRPAL